MKTLTEQLNEAMGKPDAKAQADQLKQFLKKSGHKKGSKEEQAEIEKWLDSKDFDDKDADTIVKMLESVNEAKQTIREMIGQVQGLSNDVDEFINNAGSFVNPKNQKNPRPLTLKDVQSVRKSMDSIEKLLKEIRSLSIDLRV